MKKLLKAILFMVPFTLCTVLGFGMFLTLGLYHFDSYPILSTMFLILGCIGTIGSFFIGTCLIRDEL